jgi:hypothetical protein
MKRTVIMVLSIEERKMFFKNWLKLLAFVNKKYKIIKNFGNPESPVGLNIDELMKIREKLWENSYIINEYLEKTKINNEDEKIVNSWNKYINGKFLFIKSLKKYSIFMDFDEKRLFGVYGISSPIVDMMPYLPIMIQTVLIPFNGKIIYDSLIKQDNVSFGKNMRQSFNEEYIEIKRRNGIINILDGLPPYFTHSHSTQQSKKNCQSG